ncbi:MAG: hypothetical protein AAGF04_01550 [Chlamydiota bacterium]
MGSLCVTFAALFAAAYNLCMRKSVGSFHGTQSFLMVELWMASICSYCLQNALGAASTWNGMLVLSSLSLGGIFGATLYYLGKALAYGPSSLTIASLNASNVLPSFLLFALFGPELGFPYYWHHFFGSLMVLAGIFWAAKGCGGTHQWRAWTLYCFLAIFCHVCFLVGLEWRSWMVRYPDSFAYLRIYPQDVAKSAYFLPLMYVGAACLHTLFCMQKGEKIVSLRACYLGTLGGVCNAFYALFLARAAQYASVLEHAVLFPLFSVATIFLCNLWGKWLYNEIVHWKGSLLAFSGIFLAMADWRSSYLFFQDTFPHIWEQLRWLFSQASR